MARLILFRFLESYFRHRWLYYTPILLMIAFTGVNYVRTKPNYISRGALYVQKGSLLNSLTSLQQDGMTWVTPADEAVDEFKDLMQTDAFVRAVIQKTDLEVEMSKGSVVIEKIYADVRRVVWVQPLGKNLILIGATHTNAKLAQQLASAMIATYQQWRINSDQQESATAQQFFADLLQKYQDDLNLARGALKAYLDQHPDPVRGDRPSTEKMEIDRLQGAVDLSLKQIGSALDKEENARLSMAKAESDVRQKYYVIDAPNLPEQSENSQRQAITNSLIYVAIGAVLSIVGIVIAALTDRTYRFPVDVQHGLDLYVLANVPDVSPPKGKRKEKDKEKSASQETP